MANKQRASKKSRVVHGNVDIDNIYLDPHNPRFGAVGDRNMSFAQRCTRRIQGRVRDSLDEEKTRASDTFRRLRAEGYVEASGQILSLVEHRGRKIVGEGNRRVLCMKMILEDHRSGKDKVEARILRSFKKVPAVTLVNGTKKEMEDFLRSARSSAHISPQHDWTTERKWRFIRDVYFQVGEEAAICNAKMMKKPDAMHEAFDALDLCDQAQADSICRKILRTGKKADYFTVYYELCVSRKWWRDKIGMVKVRGQKDPKKQKSKATNMTPVRKILRMYNEGEINGHKHLRDLADASELGLEVAKDFWRGESTAQDVTKALQKYKKSRSSLPAEEIIARIRAAKNMIRGEAQYTGFWVNTPPEDRAKITGELQCLERFVSNLLKKVGKNQPKLSNRKKKVG